MARLESLEPVGPPGNLVGVDMPDPDSVPDDRPCKEDLSLHPADESMPEPCDPQLLADANRPEACFEAQ